LVSNANGNSKPPTVTGVFLLLKTMDIIPKNEGQYLPDTLNDLAKFVLVGRDQLAMVRAGIKALDKLDIAEGVRRQKREEAQMLAEALLDAEVKIGEILKAMPKATGANNQYVQKVKIDSAVDFHSENQTKQEAIKSLGFNQKQVERFQKLAENKDIVEQIKQEAREADDLPTRTAVLQAVKFSSAQAAREQKIEVAAKNDWPEDQSEMRRKVENGESVVINMNAHFHLLKWAQENGKYERVDRFSEWGNPFEMPKDGNRDEVCDAYEYGYFPYKKSLHARLKMLKGKVLGCHCHPQRCHGHFLAEKSNDLEA